MAGLQILSLDGGGVRGISSLYMLKALMKRLIRQHKMTIDASEIRPFQVFDLICGTSAGGLIAIMLGRLEMVCPKAPSSSHPSMTEC
jgi:patatin-like phospholipase/acyl hydrolase